MTEAPISSLQIACANARASNLPEMQTVYTVDALPTLMLARDVLSLLACSDVISVRTKRLCPRCAVCSQTQQQPHSNRQAESIQYVSVWLYACCAEHPPLRIVLKDINLLFNYLRGHVLTRMVRTSAKHDAVHDAHGGRLPPPLRARARCNYCKISFCLRVYTEYI